MKASGAGATSTRSACTPPTPPNCFSTMRWRRPENLLGSEEGSGFVQLMQQLPQERLALAIGAVASMERAIRLTIDYTKERKAFGQPIIEFQNTGFKLAERKTEADDCARIRRLVRRSACRGRTRHRDRIDGEVVVIAEAIRDRRRMPATAWRLRLHAGIPDLADVRRLAHPEDLRRHQRDHEAADRAIPVAGVSFPGMPAGSRSNDWERG